MIDEEIKTIIFDLGGVYFTRGSFLAIERIIDKYKIKNRDMVIQTFSSRYKQEGFKLRLGLITMNEFENKLFEKLGIVEKRKDHIRKIWFGSYVPHYKMPELINTLSTRNNYRLVIFSGNIKERVEFLNDRYNFLNCFDDFLFSYDYQKDKSNIEFYEELTNHIKCTPSQAVLVDDERKNIEMAETLGFKGILYYYTEQIIEELNKYNIKININ